jgi:hypothetical protein
MSLLPRLPETKAMIRRALKKGQEWERKGPIPSLGPLFPQGDFPLKGDQDLRGVYPPNQGLLRMVPCGGKQENRR